MPQIITAGRYVSSNASTMSSLLGRLGAVGISSPFARKVLPSWWVDDIAAEPSGLQQAELYLSRAFNIELSSLEAGSIPRFRESVRKFKLSKNVPESDVSVSAQFATGIAKLALHCDSGDQSTVPRDPAELREKLLTSAKCVTLPGLLEWCAHARIPVLHIEKLPGKKMTGLVVREMGRFAVVLSKKAHPAYLLFHLAHELGHIANGHLAADGFVVDQSINGKGDGDADEKEADAYAIRLINGRSVAFNTGGKPTSGRSLCQAAVKKGLEEGIDPGHIILNVGHNANNFALANMALKSLHGPQDGGSVVNAAFFQHLDKCDPSSERLDLFRSATGYTGIAQ